MSVCVCWGASGNHHLTRASFSDQMPKCWGKKKKEKNAKKITKIKVKKKENSIQFEILV